MGRANLRLSWEQGPGLDRVRMTCPAGEIQQPPVVYLQYTMHLQYTVMYIWHLVASCLSVRWAPGIFPTIMSSTCVSMHNTFAVPVYYGVSRKVHNCWWIPLDNSVNKRTWLVWSCYLFRLYQWRFNHTGCRSRVSKYQSGSIVHSALTAWHHLWSPFLQFSLSIIINIFVKRHRQSYRGLELLPLLASYSHKLAQFHPLRESHHTDADAGRIFCLMAHMLFAAL